MTTSLQIEQLRTCRIVRPAGQIGTIGFRPRPWEIAVIDVDETPAEAFLRVNPNWRPTDLHGEDIE